MTERKIKNLSDKKYEEKFPYKLQVRMTAFEKKRFFLKIQGIEDRQKFVKDCIFNKEVIIQKTAQNKDLVEMRKELIRIGTNINQIAKAVNVKLGHLDPQEQSELAQQLASISTQLVSLNKALLV